MGGGLASLAAAAFLIRDVQMEPSRIHILETSDLPGGACDGLLRPDVGFIIRGGREMENHYECLWDLFRSIPSLEVPDASVLDEFYWLNHDDPNYSKNRATLNRGESANTKNRFDLSDEAALELMRLFFTPDEELYNKTIDDVLGEEFYRSNFWLYWQTMFAFETWHSALEMKLYLQRFLHHIGGLPDLSALKFTKYNQYESLIQPLVKFLQDNGVQFEYGVQLTNVLFHFLPDKITPTFGNGSPSFATTVRFAYFALYGDMVPTTLSISSSVRFRNSILFSKFQVPFPFFISSCAHALFSIIKL